jgi:molybdate transport system regulatory protein
MDAGFEAHLRVGEVVFDGEDAALLRAVDEHRSLNAAADALGRSYSRAHARVTDLEAAAGPLVERRRGGSGGGGSELTANARDLLARFTRLQAALDGTASTEEVVLEGTVVDREGELVTVATPAGRVRALLFEDADEVQVTFRADAVTLHTPDSVPPAVGTSARNRFRGTVTAVDESEAIAYVTVSVTPDFQLRVLVTRRSLKTLALERNADVVATFKATATRATPK